MTSPTATNFTAARILLDRIPKDQQNEVLKALLASLPTSNRLDLEMLASLAVSSTELAVKQDFMSLLQRAIQDGEMHTAVSLSRQYPNIGTELLSSAAAHVSKAKSVATDQQQSYDAVRSYLLFSKSIISHTPTSDAHTLLFNSCLELLVSEDRELVGCSRDLVFTILATNDDKFLDTVVSPARASIWECIQKLVTLQTNRPDALLGYSLWLRWVISREQQHFRDLISDDYWLLLISGLRQRDAERRKICLNILRLTTATDSKLVSNDESEQYQRYCTVFETIILGRYINQIQECEKDLNILVQSTALHPRWLFVLLASAIDSHMQDSNRKFIGNWVMRSNLRQTPDFLQLFLDDFMPWAIQGSLFVSTLKWCNGQRRCLHGDRLSQYLRKLLAGSPVQHQLVDSLVNMILHKRNTMFAYAIVYIIEGLKGAINEYQKAKLAELTNLPEVARDFVRLHTAGHLDSRTRRDLNSRREASEQEVIEKLKKLTPHAQAIADIWDDVERLEYSKQLLLAMPDAILCPTMVSCAIVDSALLATVNEKFGALLDIARTKTFLFAPLIAALREAAITTSGAIVALNIGDIVVSIAERPPAPTIDLMLEEAIVPLTSFTYEHYFGNRPSYGFAALLDLVSRLRDDQEAVSETLYRLLERWESQKVPPPTVSSWKTTLQLQVLLLCFEQFIPDSSQQIQTLLDDLFHVLAIEPLPGYRYLLEWTIVRFLMRHNLEDVLLSRLASKDHHANPKHLASLMKIGTILACREASDERFAFQLATTFVPLAASSKIVIRHEAQWQVPVLMEYARSRDWRSITDNPAFVVLDDYIRSLERFHDPPLERKIGRFDPEKDHTLTNLVEGPWLGLDEVGRSLTSRTDFVKIQGTDTDIGISESCMPVGNELEYVLPLQYDIAEDKIDGPSPGPGTANEVSALQTKGAAYLARALSDPSLHHARSSDIIVVASFVENPYNLGGLSRVSEIFGAASLCLQNQNVISNKDFTSVSVSSHLHLPIVQLSAGDVSKFLVERKSEGFKVVGIEQTDRSLLLGDENTKLPKKVVLVVGSEREGIPAIVLTECDILVEIPQRGITRSLNVQTAVSIVLYEHARQHRP